MHTNCPCKQPLEFDIQMAFQPIVDWRNQSIYAYEALVRGGNGEPAGVVLSNVNDDNLYSFDQTCRIEAIRSIAQLNRQARVSINFLPNAIYDPNTCLARTFEAADTYGFDPKNIIFEVVEHEQPLSHQRLKEIFDVYRERGMITAIDDFGAGYAGLNLLIGLKPDLIKLDRELIDHIDQHTDRQIVVQKTLEMLKLLGIQSLAEGVERREEYDWLTQHSVDLMQGYYFAKPELNALPTIPAECW